MEEQPQGPSEDRPEDAGTEGEHLSSPEPGHPAEETQPPGGVPEGAHEHPEDIGGTTPDKDTSP